MGEEARPSQTRRWLVGPAVVYLIHLAASQLGVDGDLSCRSKKRLRGTQGCGWPASNSSELSCHQRLPRSPASSMATPSERLRLTWSDARAAKMQIGATMLRWEAMLRPLPCGHQLGVAQVGAAAPIRLTSRHRCGQTRHAFQSVLDVATDHLNCFLALCASGRCSTGSTESKIRPPL